MVDGCLAILLSVSNPPEHLDTHQLSCDPLLNLSSQCIEVQTIGDAPLPTTIY